MALLEFYGMFDYAAGDSDVYEYTSAEWSKFISAITNNGVPTGSFTATVITRFSWPFSRKRRPFSVLTALSPS